MKSTGGARILLIGYGSDLRGDDGAGRRAAEIVAERSEGAIKVRSVHQLTPDLAPVLAESDLTIFVDACAEELGQPIRVRKLLPASPDLRHAHFGSPDELLGLAEWLYGHSPDAWAVDIGAFDFQFGTTFSSCAEQGVGEAVAWIESLVSQQRSDVPCMK